MDKSSFGRMADEAIGIAAATGALRPASPRHVHTLIYRRKACGGWDYDLGLCAWAPLTQR